ncbi:MAG: restriction endonuclease subunit S [Truepera sp.]|nr:restriction endonuclease subunit S [Truepera sp.]
MAPFIPTFKPYPTHKPSGVEWLGNVPAHWDIERAKWLFQKMERPVRDEDEIVTCFRDGVVTLRKNRREAGFTESLKEIGYQGIRQGDLVIHAMDGFAGAIGVADSDGKGTPVYSVCKPRSQVNAYFYAYTLREMARNGWIQALAKGIRERSSDFRYRDFAVQPLPFPPLPEQTAITRFLDYTDRRIQRYIRAKQKLITLLEEQKQAIIHQAVTGQIDVRTGQPYPAYKDSGVEWLGEVPEHWGVIGLKRVLTQLIDCEHKTAPAVTESDYFVIRTAAVRGGNLHWEGTYCTDSSSYKEWTKRGVPEPGDVIFTREAPAGEACLVPEGRRVCLGQRTVLLRPDHTQYDPRFLVHMIYAGPPRTRIQLASQGSTVGHFNIDDIGWMPVLLPPLDEQKQIVEVLQHMTCRIDRARQGSEREVCLLSEYRTRLISDVVTGKLDVREAAAKLPEVDPLETEADLETLEPTTELTEEHEAIAEGA